MEANALRVLPAEALDTRQMDRLAEIYAQAFPPDLRVPLADLAADSPRDRLLVAVDNAEPVGLAALRLLGRVDWVFLRYYAVAADRRRTGLGRAFWDLTLQQLADDRWPARIAFEVEDPAEAVCDAAEHAVRRGRINFWVSCGAAQLTVPGYVMPALTAIGQSEPMILMSADPAGTSRSSSDLAALVRAIFTDHYGLATDDKLLVTALGSIKSNSRD
ncbi:MAG TPA: GNAT family N-acetyltransferase [Streptosporangiaceae bacterium]|nr:GNAT family N-acetyltransferase [Streptosporangiaceae bacterium]